MGHSDGSGREAVRIDHVQGGAALPGQVGGQRHGRGGRGGAAGVGPHDDR